MYFARFRADFQQRIAKMGGPRCHKGAAWSDLGHAHVEFASVLPPPRTHRWCRPVRQGVDQAVDLRA
jgi:hypothetical protein